MLSNSIDTCTCKRQEETFTWSIIPYLNVTKDTYFHKVMKRFPQLFNRALVYCSPGYWVFLRMNEEKYLFENLKSILPNLNTKGVANSNKYDK